MFYERLYLDAIIREEGVGGWGGGRFAMIVSYGLPGNTKMVVSGLAMQQSMVVESQQ